MLDVCKDLAFGDISASKEMKCGEEASIAHPAAKRDET